MKREYMHVVIFIFILTINIIHCTITIQKNTNGEQVFWLNNNQTYLRGSNYLRLINASIHVLFEPDLYPQWQQEIEIALKQMHTYGYNYVKIFIDSPTLFHGFGLSTPGIPVNYTKNIVDFLIRASQYGIMVILTASWNPANYQSIIDSYPLPANVTGMNLIIFHAGQAAAKAQFFIDFLQQIQNMSLVAFENIFSIDIFGEIYVSVHEQPYSLTSGNVTFDGISYDMGNGIDRQQLVDVFGNIWFNTVAKAIKSVSSSILVSTSQFSPNAVGHNGFDGVQPRPPNADDRYPLRSASLVNSLADYIDLHVYPIYNNTQVEFEGAALTRIKPLLLGETGAFKFAHLNPSIGATAIKNTMIESVKYGFTGWGIWTWDTVEQLSLWTLAEANNTMNNILAPSVWPFVGPNVTSTTTN